MTGLTTLRPVATGRSRILGIVGHPIAQVRAPQMWSELFRHNNIDIVCVPLHVRPENLDGFLLTMKSLENLAGLIVTVPHKPAAVLSVSHPTERAELVGAVNILRLDSAGDWHGDIVDGAGFVAGLLARGQRVAGRRALVVGAGGVGTAIAVALAQAGVAEVAVSDVALDRAELLVSKIAVTGVSARVSDPDAHGFDLVVNASPVGMKADDPLPIRCEHLGPDAIAADVVMYPGSTKFLTVAQERGCFVQPGSYMMDHQISVMAEFFGFTGGDWSTDAVARTGF